jgi:putative heme-binding domain-containing protein
LLDAAENTTTFITKLIKHDGKSDDFASHLKRIHAAARRIAADPKAPAGDRNLAVRLLARGIGDDREDYKLIASLLTPQTPDDLQLSALQSLSKSVDPRVVRVILAPWKTYSPALRAQALDVLLSRPAWTRLLGEALERNQVLSSEVDSVRRQRLLDHKDAQIRELAARVFAAASSPDRNRLVSEYQLRMPEKGDRERGAKLFAKTCAACHKLGDIGQQVGPDLASVGDKSPAGLLVAILDPNRVVEARYVNYQATTKDGRTLTGLLASETGTSITLVGADGKANSLLRTEIDELASTGKSVMPEGLEKELPPADMADLIAFVRFHLPTETRKTFPGNSPATAKPGQDGGFHLLANNAAIYGPSLVFESQHGNLGYWTSPQDHAAWTVDVPQERTFAVSLHYACEKGSAGNAFSLRIGETTIHGEVAGTGSWNDYRRVRVGEVRLSAGRHEVTMRSRGPVRGALIDLRAIELVPVK